MTKEIELVKESKKLQQRLRETNRNFIDQIKALKKGEISDIKTVDSLGEELANRLEEINTDLADLFRKKNCVILTDWSSSMAGIKETELKKAIKQVISKYPAIELIRFDSIVESIKPSDVDKMFVDGSTVMGKALIVAWDMETEKIILITDGQPTDMSKEKVLEKAKEYSYVPIHIIGIGEPGEGKEDLDEMFLRRLAGITGGSYTRLEIKEIQLLDQKVQYLLE